MKTIAAKYVAPLMLAVGIAGGFAGFELSQAFTFRSAENGVRSDESSRRHVENPQANPTGPQREQAGDKRPLDPEPGPRTPRPII